MLMPARTWTPPEKRTGKKNPPVQGGTEKVRASRAIHATNEASLASTTAWRNRATRVMPARLRGRHTSPFPAFRLHEKKPAQGGLFGGA